MVELNPTRGKNNNTTSTMKIYTKRGDNGTTTIGGEMVTKSDVAIQLAGEVDRVATDIATAVAYLEQVTDVDDLDKFKRVSNKLIRRSGCADNALDEFSALYPIYALGARLHTNKDGPNLHFKIIALELEIDAMTKEMPPLTNFVVPHGKIACHLHQARVSVRSLERKLAEYIATPRAIQISSRNYGWNYLFIYFLDWLVARAPKVNMEFTWERAYLNRLSDYLFTAARYIALAERQSEMIWKQ